MRVVVAVRSSLSAEPPAVRISTRDGVIVASREPALLANGRVDEAHHDVRAQRFAFHAVHSACASPQLYAREVRPLVHAVLRGESAACIIIGGRASGKTFALVGAPQPDFRGAIICAARELLDARAEAARGGDEFELSLSVLAVGATGLSDELQPVAALRHALALATDADGRLAVRGQLCVPLRDWADADEALRAAGARQGGKARPSALHADEPPPPALVYSLHLARASGGAASQPRAPRASRASRSLHFVEMRTAADDGAPARSPLVGGALAALVVALSARAERAAARRDGRALRQPAPPASAHGSLAARDHRLTHVLSDALGSGSQLVAIACVHPALARVGETLIALRAAASLMRAAGGAPTAGSAPARAALAAAPAERAAADASWLAAEEEEARRAQPQPQSQPHASPAACPQPLPSSAPAGAGGAPQVDWVTRPEDSAQARAQPARSRHTAPQVDAPAHERAAWTAPGSSSHSAEAAAVAAQARAASARSGSAAASREGDDWFAAAGAAESAAAASAAARGCRPSAPSLSPSRVGLGALGGAAWAASGALLTGAPPDSPTLTARAYALRGPQSSPRAAPPGAHSPYYAGAVAAQAPRSWRADAPAPTLALLSARRSALPACLSLPASASEDLGAAIDALCRLDAALSRVADAADALPADAALAPPADARDALQSGPSVRAVDVLQTGVASARTAAAELGSHAAALHECALGTAAVARALGGALVDADADGADALDAAGRACALLGARAAEAVRAASAHGARAADAEASLAALAADAEAVVRAATDAADGALSESLAAVSARHAAELGAAAEAAQLARAEAAALRAAAQRGAQPRRTAPDAHVVAHGARWASTANDDAAAADVSAALAAAAAEAEDARGARARAEEELARTRADARAETAGERAAAHAARTDALALQARLTRVEASARARAAESERAHARALDASGRELAAMRKRAQAAEAAAGDTARSVGDARRAAAAEARAAAATALRARESTLARATAAEARGSDADARNAELRAELARARRAELAGTRALAAARAEAAVVGRALAAELGACETAVMMTDSLSRALRAARAEATDAHAGLAAAQARHARETGEMRRELAVLHIMNADLLAARAAAADAAAAAPGAHGGGAEAAASALGGSAGMGGGAAPSASGSAATARRWRAGALGEHASGWTDLGSAGGLAVGSDGDARLARARARAAELEGLHRSQLTDLMLTHSRAEAAWDARNRAAQAAVEAAGRELDASRVAQLQAAADAASARRDGAAAQRARDEALEHGRDEARAAERRAREAGDALADALRAGAEAEDRAAAWEREARQHEAHARAIERACARALKEAEDEVARAREVERAWQGAVADGDDDGRDDGDGRDALGDYGDGDSDDGGSDDDDDVGFEFEVAGGHHTAGAARPEPQVDRGRRAPSVASASFAAGARARAAESVASRSNLAGAQSSELPLGSAWPKGAQPWAAPAPSACGSAASRDTAEPSASGAALPRSRLNDRAPRLTRQTS